MIRYRYSFLRRLSVNCFVKPLVQNAWMGIGKYCFSLWNKMAAIFLYRKKCLCKSIQDERKKRVELLLRILVKDT